MSGYTYYVNGRFVPDREAVLGVGDLGLVRGYGVFDFLRTYGGVPFQLREHLERLKRSADLIELKLPWSLDQLSDIVVQTLRRNADKGDVGIRIVATGGSSTDFLIPDADPSLIVMVSAVASPAAELVQQGASLVTVDDQRHMPAVKSLDYVMAVTAQRRARAAGAVEALYCDRATGELSECTTSNFFVVRGDELITSGDVLAGITRSLTLELASGLLRVVERPIQLSELSEVDEAFITSTTKEILPIVRVDDVQVGGGRPGPRTLELLRRFRRECEPAKDR